MVRYTEVGIYMDPVDAKAVQEAAEDSEYDSTSGYVRSFLPECSEE